MKLKGQPKLLRTVIGQVEHKKKSYEIVIQENETENDYEIFEIDSAGLPSDMIEVDSDLGKELIEFFERETEDIEQFL